MAATYEPISTQTLGSAVASVTFSSIPQTYTDLVLVTSVKLSSGGAAGSIEMQYNSDTATNYSYTYISGSGATASSGRGSNYTAAVFGQGGNSSNSEFAVSIAHILNYANTTTYKTTVSRANESSTNVQSWTSLWRSTAAISTIKVQSNFATGSMFTLYGIKAA
jgi:hypothetical protein